MQSCSSGLAGEGGRVGHQSGDVVGSPCRFSFFLFSRICCFPFLLFWDRSFVRLGAVCVSSSGRRCWLLLSQSFFPESDQRLFHMPDSQLELLWLNHLGQLSVFVRKKHNSAYAYIYGTWLLDEVPRPYSHLEVVVNAKSKLSLFPTCHDHPVQTDRPQYRGTYVKPSLVHSRFSCLCGRATLNWVLVYSSGWVAGNMAYKNSMLTIAWCPHWGLGDFIL